MYTVNHTQFQTENISQKQYLPAMIWLDTALTLAATEANDDIVYVLAVDYSKILS